MRDNALKSTQDPVTGALKRPIVQHFRLLAMLVGRELKVKYRNSILGYLWSMLNPLFFMMIITLVFSRLVRGVEHYDIYVLSGILFWNMTSMGLLGATNGLVNNSGLLRKVKAPYWVFVLVPICAAAVNCILALIPYTLILLIRGIPIEMQILASPIVLLLYVCFLAGIGVVLGILNVYFRDVGHVMEPLLQLLFYATPIIYERNNQIFPQWAHDLLGLNPILYFIELFRSCLFSSQYFSWQGLALTCLLSVISLVIATLFYRKAVVKLSFSI